MNFLAKATVSSLVKLTLWVLASAALFNKKAAYAWICWGSLYKVFFYWEVRMAGRKANYFLHQNDSNILTLHNISLLLECISLVFPCAFFFFLTDIYWFILTTLGSFWDLRSWTKYWTRVSCSRGRESPLLEHWGILPPSVLCPYFYWNKTGPLLVCKAPQTSPLGSIFLVPSLLQRFSKWEESESVIHSVVSDCVWPHRLQPPRLLCPWDSPGKNTGVACHVLLQGIFPTRGSNLGLLHCRQILYYLSHQGSETLHACALWT